MDASLVSLKMISEALKIVRFGSSSGRHAPDQGNPGNGPDEKICKNYGAENLNQCTRTCTYMYV